MDLSEKMVNVRRATRLLASYYRRLIDIMAMVEGVLVEQPKLNLTFRRWGSTYHHNIGYQTKSPVGRWGWDFLPLQDAWFDYTSGGQRVPDGKGNLYVCLQHITDSVYEKNEDESDVAFAQEKERSVSKPIFQQF